jgi:4'-phosphopantetheinyl transferase
VHNPSWKNQPLAGPLSLANDQLHIWKLQLDASPGDVLKLLSPAERQRHAAFRHPRAALRFLNTRSLTRRILGAYLQQAPASLEIRSAEGGKPYLQGHPLEFNLSHSRGLGLLAISAARPLGVDLEQLRPVKYPGRIAARIFNIRELERLQNQSESESRQQFFSHWTAMEARQKTLGRGIFQPRVGNDEADCLHFIPEPGYIAAIASVTPLSIPGLKFLKPG